VVIGAGVIVDPTYQEVPNSPIAGMLVPELWKGICFLMAAVALVSYAQISSWICLKRFVKTAFQRTIEELSAEQAQAYYGE
jgi:NAD/NADP transhydrogenase beta subunit